MNLKMKTLVLAALVTACLVIGTTPVMAMTPDGFPSGERPMFPDYPSLLPVHVMEKSTEYICQTPSALLHYYPPLLVFDYVSGKWLPMPPGDWHAM